MAQVLVVDDESDIRWIVSKVLEAAGYGVVLACNGAEALDCLRAGPADCILLDLHMPVMDGTSFLEAWRADGGYTRVLVALFTSEDAGVKTAAALEVQACIAKPFDLDAVTDTVSRLIGQRGGVPLTGDARQHACVRPLTPGRLEFLRQRASWTRQATARSQRTILSAENCLDEAGWRTWPCDPAHMARLPLAA